MTFHVNVLKLAKLLIQMCSLQSVSFHKWVTLPGHFLVSKVIELPGDNGVEVYCGSGC